MEKKKKEEKTTTTTTTTKTTPTASPFPYSQKNPSYVLKSRDQSGQYITPHWKKLTLLLQKKQFFEN